MRTGFLTALFLSAAVTVASGDAAAGPQRKPACAQDRVRVDAVFDLETGETIHSTMGEAELREIPIHPASLTKVEGVKEMMRRIISGVWPRDKTFEVAARPGEKKVPRTPDEIARMSMVTSFNVLDQVAEREPGFMESIRAYVRKLGMKDTNYVSPTGNPEKGNSVRDEHRTTVYDLMLSVRDYHLNYAVPHKMRAAFGRESVSGLPDISDIEGLPRAHNTLTLLENATARRAQPVEGVSDGKTGYICNSGFGEYFKYDLKSGFNARSFLVFTLGHDTKQERQKAALNLIDSQHAAMKEFMNRRVPRFAEQSHASVRVDGDPVSAPLPASATSGAAPMTFDAE